MNPIARILVPVDFSECALAALDHATVLAERFGASIDVLYVREPPPSAASLYLVPALDSYGAQSLLEEFAHTEAGRQMEQLMKQLESRFIKVRGRLESGDPCDTILELITRDEYDLVVMGTHGRTGLARFISGSVAERVVRHSRCPVLTVRVPPTETAAATAP